MPIEWEEALRAAEQRTGLSDWGGSGFLEGLKAFTDAVNRDPKLSDEARARIEAQVGATLDQRLRLYDDRRRYPEIAAQRIDDPLIVVGLPRSGTTFLHALLAQDPRARSPLSWELGQLSPPPRRETADTDPRIEATQARMDELPLEFKQMHMVGAKLPEECNAITTLAFQSSNHSAANCLPSYVEWYLQADDTAPYEVHKHVLQHLQAFSPKDWWVLKSPPHMFHLPRLLKTYPNARFVFPHRSPVTTIPSLASLIAHLRRGVYGSAHDDRTVGPEMSDYWRVALTRALEFRRDPAIDKHFVDVRYETLVGDPMAAVRAIYDHFGIGMTPQAEAAIVKFLADQPKDKHGAHRYTPEEFGLDAGRIKRDFADYIDTWLS